MENTQNNEQKLRDLGEHLKQSMSPNTPFILNGELKPIIEGVTINGSLWAISIRLDFFTAVIECSTQKEMIEVKKKLQNCENIELYVRSDKRFLAPINNIKKDKFITPLWTIPGFLSSKVFPEFQDGKITVNV